MNNDLQITALKRDSRSISRFLELAYLIYRQDPYWVAPIISDLKKVFTDANPLFHHAEMQLWVASQNGRDVGRIAAIIDRTHQQIQKRADGFFGFFESENNSAVSRALFETACSWAKARGCTHILGPMNPTTNDEAGLLVDGFGSSPVFMMTYNPQYYVGLVEAEGFAKAKDLVAYHFDLSHIPMDRLGRIGEKVKKRNAELSFRAVTKRSLDGDLSKIKEIYNEAWQDNWGFVPMTDPEINFMAERLKPLLYEGLVWLAECGSEPVAFLLALPDYNVPIKPLRGRLLTPRLLGFIPYVLGWKCPPRTRVLTLGVKENYRSRGLESALLIEGLKVGFNAGVTESEASWILEDNEAMRKVLEAIGGRVYKTYRIYEKAI